LRAGPLAWTGPLVIGRRPSDRKRRPLVWAGPAGVVSEMARRVVRL